MATAEKTTWLKTEPKSPNAKLPSVKSFDVIVLGGGVTGLAAAYYLLKKGLSVCIIEKDKSLGGILASEKINSFYIEQFYHHFFKKDKFFKSFIEEIGLTEQIEWKEPKTTFLYNKHYALRGAFDLLKFSALTLTEKIEIAKLMISIKMTKNLENFDSITAKDYIISRGGIKIYNKMFKFLLESKFGANAEEASAAWFIKRLKLRSDVGKDGEILGYPKGGFHIILEKCIDEIKKMGGKIGINAKTTRILTEGDKFIGIASGKGKISAKYLVSTIPPAELFRLGLDTDAFRETRKGLEYQGAICIILGLKKSISDSYWTNIMQKNSFGAVIEHTNFMPLEDYENIHLAYLASYLENESEIWQMADAEITRKYLNDFFMLFPHITKEDIIFTKISKNKFAGLCYKTGTLNRINSLSTGMSNVFLSGMFDAFPERGIDLSIEKAVNIAEKISELEGKNNLIEIF